MREHGSANIIAFPRNADYYHNRGIKFLQQNRLRKGILFLRRSIELEPANPNYRFDLAAMYCQCGLLEEANREFLKIVQDIDPDMTQCYFFLALNHGLLGDLKTAVHYLNIYLQINPSGEMAPDAAELLDYIHTVDSESNLTQVENFHREWLSPETLLKMLQDPVLFNFLRQRLRFGNHMQKLHIVHMLGDVADSSSLQLLQEVASASRQPREVREAAFIHLQRNRVQCAYKRRFPERKPWLSQWDSVLTSLRQGCREIFQHPDYFSEAEAIWRDFLFCLGPEKPAIKKPETWAAGVVYALSCYHFMQVTQADIAEAFSVSPASVSEKFRTIDRLIDIRLMARKAMDSYLYSSP